MRALTRDRRAFTATVLAVAASVLMGAAGLVAGGSGSARAAGGAVVLDAGDLDLTPRPVDGKLELQIDDRSGGTAVVREPSEVVLHAAPSSLQHTPSPLAEAFGLVSHDTWQLNGQQADQIFAPEPGWNGSEAGADTEVTLSGYEGPAVFGMATFTFDMEMADEAPVVYVGSADPAPRAFTLAAGAGRQAPTWMFDAEGVYRLTFTVTGGGSSDTETLAVVVGDDVDPSDVLPGDGSTPTPTTPTTPTTSSTPTNSSPSPSTTPTATPTAHVIDNGHLDLAARPVDGDLRFQIKEGSAYDYEWYEPDRIVLHVKPAARRKITDGYEFLGTVGDPVWWLPMQQLDGLVWPGWSTEAYAKSDLDGGVDYRLDAVRGPGSVAVFTEESLGSVTTYLNSGDGLPDTFTHSVHSHSHKVWVFAAEGVYRTTFTVSATLADGTKVSDTETIAWVVGDDTDPSTVTPGEGNEQTATPTAAPSESASQPPTANATATPTASVSASASVSNSPAADGGSSTGGTGIGTGSGGASTTGGLASTGAQAGVIAGIAVAAVLVGGGAVFFVRRRRSAQ